jgi:hypothetical protein
MHAKQAVAMWGTVVLMLLAIQGVALAQQKEDLIELQSSTCFSSHTSGSGATFMGICFSNHGNLVRFESPAGFVHLSVIEGYALCSGDPFQPAQGFDSGTVEAGFNPATISQPNGPNTFPLTITRTTTDGAFRLQQTFARDSVEKDVTITMVLRNISAAPIADVFLTRYFDGDIDNFAANDFYDQTLDSVWGKESFGASGHGLMLTALTFGTSHGTDIESFTDWKRTNGSTCRPPFGSQGGPVGEGDFVGRLTYELGTLNAGQSKTVRVLYRRF